jgi:hypothetical protein
MNAVRKELFRLLGELSDRHPEWRLGQLVANVTLWARQPTEPHDTGIWDVEDEELLAALQSHLSRRDNVNVA